uniref:Major facilitator superfamily (MFS) profile domain-containing protein n=1 Tax=Aspergillus terreus TaxID=33178 RepID=Q9Y7E0_ASPTE|nr:unknown [Aspergillus terreus]
MGRGDTESPNPATTSEGSGQNEPEKKGRDIPLWRKCVITFVVSWMTLVVTFSSTCLLPAAPEIANEFDMTVETINISNAGVLVAMGYSSLIWGPMNKLVGRRTSYNLAISMLCACSAGTAAAINEKMFIAFRVLSGLTGTSFMVSGQTVLADIFEPVYRGTAVGFFMAGTLSGPAIACVGGVIVTFTSWRVIFWLQLGMSGLGLVLSLLFFPKIEGTSEKVSTAFKPTTLVSIISKFSPTDVLKQWVYPNVFLAVSAWEICPLHLLETKCSCRKQKDLCCGLLAITQYSILTSARAIFNSRFHLTTALVSGLFYLAPGAGFLIGSLVGGKLSDRTVRRYIVKRGFRLPQDRLHSGLITLFAVLPAGTLIYGWTLQEDKGGMVVPIIAAFFAGWGLMGSFNCLNTYVAVEALPRNRSAVIAGKYMIQYSFSAGSSALVVPVIDALGVGWTFTLCVVASTIAGLITAAIARWGINMQRWAERAFNLPTQ